MIILASKSPRRRELLSAAGFAFECIPAIRDEVLESGLDPREAAKLLGLRKAEEVAEKHPNDTVIGADTIVVLGSEIMGKPRDKADAFRMLRALSGKTHRVITGVTVISDGKAESFYDETEVEFYPLSDAEINDYTATGEPFDKAGAYGIQGVGMLLVKAIKGDFYNVMGLPIARLYRLLKNIE